MSEPGGLEDALRRAAGVVSEAELDARLREAARRRQLAPSREDAEAARRQRERDEASQALAVEQGSSARVLAAATDFAARAAALRLEWVAEYVYVSERVYRSTLFGKRATGETRWALASDRVIGWQLITPRPRLDYGLRIALEESKKYFVTKTGAIMVCPTSQYDPGPSYGLEGGTDHIYSFRPVDLDVRTPDLAVRLIDAMARTLLEPSPFPYEQTVMHPHYSPGREAWLVRGNPPQAPARFRYTR